MWMGLDCRTIALVFATILQLVTFLATASAQMEAPQTFGQPVPDNWRAPYASFLNSIGVTEVETIIGETKFAIVDNPNAILGAHDASDFAIFRIEDKKSCDDDVCLTGVGHLSAERFVADALFFAGPKTNGYDYAVQLLDV